MDDALYFRMASCYLWVGSFMAFGNWSRVMDIIDMDKFCVTCYSSFSVS